MNHGWLVAALVVVAVVLGRRDTRQTVIDTVETMVYGKTRGLRNNNPGNIRRSNDKWQGLSPEQTDSEFFQFTDPVYGIRALARVLINYQNKHGLGTVAQIVNRWAPPSENNTGAYVRHVAGALGVDENEWLAMDNATLKKLVAVIIQHENGSQPYPDTMLQRGIELARA